MTIQLTGLVDAQSILLSLSNITSAAGGTLASAVIPIRFCEGDSNGSGDVKAGDIALVKSQVGQPVSMFNFREDLNMNASITASDVNVVKAKSGSTIAGGAMANTPPTIGTIVDQTTNSGTVTVAFTVGDAELAAGSLGVRATSDNPTLLPAGTSYAFGGSGSTRTLTITSAQNQVGTANVTVSVSDGNAVASTNFVLTVNATPKLFIARLYPASGVTTQGWGTSALTLDGDESAANVQVDYSSLTANAGAIKVKGPSGVLVNDLTTLPQNSDGSYRWVFPTDGSAPAIASAIKNNTVTLAVVASLNINGEIVGTFKQQIGSETFTPPAALAPVSSGPTSQNDAARFLRQATFGPSMDDINNLMSIGYVQWLNQQFDPSQNPPSLTYPVVYQRCTTSSAGADQLGSERVLETWWKNAIIAPDQLRQRVASAYLEIFVVSAEDGTIDNQAPGLATYYDMLVNDAFVNFRTLMKDVTLHPIMGQYLNMRGNLKPTSPNYTAPNENYAREVMQLFSIGLIALHPDGTIKLDTKGLPIPTYDQNVIQGFAHVFTGWNTDPTPVVIPQLTSTGVVNFNSFYNKPMVVTASNHSTYSKLLLNGQVIPQWSGTMTATQANLELDTALDNIFNHPNVGPFICRELIQRLVCSDPSPAYVYRAAQVFNNDGTGVRGNMKAVIQAILLDQEARSTSLLNTQGYGHLSEPIIRMANVIRAFHPTTISGYWKVNSTEADGAQAPFHAPTVFNFFEPAFTPPGILQDAGLYAPEFEITYEATAIGMSNQMYQGVYNSWKGNDVKSDLTNEANLLQNNPSTGVGLLMDELNLLLMSGQMTPAMRDRITTYVNTMSSTDYLGRARAALHLVVTSPHYAVTR
jgi:uncharacterized protein (DUF1800 family)